jgi:hypothetical protein
MAFCLTKDQTNKLITAVQSGKIDLENFHLLTSEARRAKLSEFVTELNAKEVNAVIEQTIIRKDQMRALTTFVDKLGGKKEVKRDLLLRVQKMEGILKPENVDMFLEDLVAKRLGGRVSLEQASKIVELSKQITDAKEAGNWKEYGKSLAIFSEYTNALKNPQTTWSEFGKSIYKDPGKAVVEFPGVLKSAKSAIDASMLMRQGIVPMITNPKIWANNALKVMNDAKRTMKGEDVLLDVKAEGFSRENYRNGLYGKEKLDIGAIEEAFPSSRLESIPGLGKVYKTSNVIFSAFLHRMRMDLFDYHAKNILEVGGDVTGLGRLVNSMTGRGPLPKTIEPASAFLNNIFFSPRLLASRIDTLVHPFQKGESIQVRKISAINLVKTIGAMSAVLATVKALYPDSVEEDPRSADFGKIRIGNSRFDMTGGFSSLFVLASRLSTMSSKSSTTKQVKKLNTGEFGSQTGWDVFLNFSENKLAPFSSVVKDILSGTNFAGEKVTVGGELMNAFAPISLQNIQESIKTPNSAPLLLTIIADALGISANTYGSNSIWANSDTEEMNQFKEKVGEDRFNEANKEYNRLMDEWYADVNKNAKFKALSDDDKKTLISRNKTKIKESVFKKYGFKKNTKKAKKKVIKI